MIKKSEIAHLSPCARKKVKQIEKLWQLQCHQETLLIKYGETMDEERESRRIINEEGLTIRDRFGQLRPHPCVKISNDAKILMARLLRELNLSIEVPEEPRIPRNR